MAIKKRATKKTEITYEVMEECGTIGQRSGGYEVKLRYMAWNGKEPKYDLRPWKIDEDGSERAGKGISLEGEELETLCEIIEGLKDEKDGE